MQGRIVDLQYVSRTLDESRILYEYSIRIRTQGANMCVCAICPPPLKLAIKWQSPSQCPQIEHPNSCLFWFLLCRGWECIFDTGSYQHVWLMRSMSPVIEAEFGTDGWHREGKVYHPAILGDSMIRFTRPVKNLKYWPVKWNPNYCVEKPCTSVHSARSLKPVWTSPCFDRTALTCQQSAILPVRRPKGIR